MSVVLPRRRLIPRWRPILHTLETPEVTSNLNREPQRLEFDHDQFASSVAAWELHPTAGHLGDVLAFSADTTLRPKISGLLTKALDAGYPVSAAQRSLFQEIQSELSPSDDTSSEGRLYFQARVSHLRQELLVAPDNVLALLDLAQLQLAVGKRATADRFLRTALALAPNNRIVLRTRARFYVHLGEYDAAHSLIMRHPGAKDDPWLIASEIALADAANKSSTLLGVGRKLIKQGRYSPHQLAELAGALANRELFDGKMKEAREHLRLALQQPTDNVVAQAVGDAAHMSVRLDEPNIVAAVRGSAEAQLLQAWFTSADEKMSEVHALKWHAEEPFSSRPLQFLTSLHANQGNYRIALQWIQLGLLADPNDPGMLRNLAFSLAAAGDLNAAETAIRQTHPGSSGPTDAFVMATQGLVELRRRDFIRAGLMYRDAEKSFLSQSAPHLAAFCIVNYAKFAIEEAAPNAAMLLAEAVDKVKKAPTPDSLLVLSRLLAEPVTVLPEQQDQRRLSQWVFDRDANTLTKLSKLTTRGAPGFVVKENSKNQKKK